MISPYVKNKPNPIMKGDIMKNTFKRLSAVLFSTALVASLGMASIPASYAADYTVTINQPESDKAAHTYEAYQVFTGTLHGTGENAVLSNVDWGSGVNGDALLNELKTTEFESATPFSACTNAQAVANVLDDLTDNAANLQKFADIVAKHLKATPTVTGTKGNNSFPVDDPGYYFIKDADNSLSNAESAAYTDYILKVVDSVTIDAKEDVPTITKKIVEGENLVQANTASLGDIIDFQLDSKVPDMSGYNKYYYIINDTMDAGLEFDETSVKVYIGDNAIAATDYEVQTGTAAGSYTFQIVMNQFETRHKDDVGKTIKVTYSAKLNDKADRSTTGNPNAVNLTYSNNPNHNYTGVNEPGTSDVNVTGQTPDSITKTYTTGIMLRKIDGSTKKALAGAKFKLQGKNVNRAIITNAESFEENDSGEFYKLKDGTFTKTAPTAATMDQYNETAPNQRYAIKEQTSVMHSVSGEDYYIEAQVDDYGILTFEGLGEGTYTLIETKAPEKYNSVSPISIVISANPTLSGPNWKITEDGAAL